MQKCDKQRFMKGNVSRFGRGYEATAKENDTEGNEQGLEYCIGQARYHAPPVKSSDGQARQEGSQRLCRLMLLVSIAHISTFRIWH